MKTIDVTDEQYEMMKELCRLRQTQDNRATANPIWFVQTLKSRPCDPEYGECVYILTYDGDDEFEPTDDIEKFKIRFQEWVKTDLEREIDWNDDNKYNYTSFNSINYWYELEDWIEHFRHIELNDAPLYFLSIEYYYENVATFLTDEKAQHYLEYQAHNLNNPRTFVDYTGYANYGYLPKLLDMLKELKFKEEEVDEK